VCGQGHIQDVRENGVAYLAGDALFLRGNVQDKLFASQPGESGIEQTNGGLHAAHPLF